MNIGRKTDQEFCKPTGPWHIVQEACSKSNQGDQEVRRAVDGKPSVTQFSDIESFHIPLNLSSWALPIVKRSLTCLSLR